MKRLLILLMLATPAMAGQLTTPYHTTIPNTPGGKRAYIVWCTPGDHATGGGAICPPGQHLQYSTLVTGFQDNLLHQGWKANCQTFEGQEIKPLKITVICENQQCVDNSECFVDP